MKFSLVMLLLFNLSILFSQLHPVNEVIIEPFFMNKKYKKEKITSFAISNLITVNEFNEYLKAIKNDSSEIYYNSQFPSSLFFPRKLVNLILSDSTLQNEPMPGVSWSVARNYCNWINNKSPEIAKEYKYDLPSVYELIAFHNLYNISNNSILESWTLNSYDESFNLFENPEMYSYNAADNDPPAMKRKLVFGGSYHIPYNGVNRYRNMYEYQDSSSRYVGFRIVKRFNNDTNKSIFIDDLNVKYSLKNNQLNGIYQEIYPNGKLKVLGIFINGNRYGIWSIWDENGELKIQRNYKNNKQSDFLYPEVNNPFNKVYNAFPEYKVQRNNDNYYPYSYVEERDVVYSKRAWRVLSIDNENELFKQIDFSLLLNSLFQNNTKWYYYGEKGDFKNEIPTDSISKLASLFNSWDLNRIEIKEDYFFDMNNLLSDTRQIGISFYENDKDIKPSFSVYYPSLRRIFATIKFANSELKEIENLDDFFFFHAYRGSIIYDINEDFLSKNNIQPYNEFRIELEKLVKEHNLWLLYGR